MRRPRFEVRQTATGWHFVLIAPNGEPVLTSEVYTSRQACREGVAAVKRYALVARILDVDLR